MESEKNRSITTTGAGGRASSAATVNYTKRILPMLRSMAKAKSILTAIKSKSEATKARVLLLLSLARNGKKPSPMLALSHKIHSSLLAPADYHGDRQRQDIRPDISSSSTGDLKCTRRCRCLADHHHHRDGTVVVHEEDQSLVVFDDPDPNPEEEKDELEKLMLKRGGDPNSSVIDLIRNSKEEVGENFSLEAEIDHVADLFILKFHKKMRMQKLESFKRYQQMLERSAA